MGTHGAREGQVLPVIEAGIRQGPRIVPPNGSWVVGAETALQFLIAEQLPAKVGTRNETAEFYRRGRPWPRHRSQTAAGVAWLTSHA